MIAAMVVVLASAAAFSSCAPWLAARLAPATAVWLLVPASVAVTMAAGFVLGVVAFTWIGQDPEVAEYGPWSPDVLAATTPFSRTSSVSATVVLAAVTVWTVLFTVRRVRAMLRLHRDCGRLGAPGSLVVVDADIPDAFTTPEITGRIVVTQGMLRALPPDERAAMLAHERSHLAHRHPWWIAPMDVVAAANPLLRPAARAVRQCVERWADEDAARVLADRRLVARAVARAAMARHTHTRARAAPAVTGGNVPARVTALLHPPRYAPIAALLVLAITVGLVVSAAAGAVTEQHRGEQLFEHAHAVPVSRLPAGTPVRSVVRR